MQSVENRQPNEENEVEKHWYSSKEVIDLNKAKFDEIYRKHNFDLLLKSKDFDYKRAFLFDDGNYVTVYNDNSKKHLLVRADREENINKLTAEKGKLLSETLTELVKDVYDCVHYFSRGVKFLSNNYYRIINTNKEGVFEHKYSNDEALMTIVSAFNLNGNNADYIKTILNDGRSKIEINDTVFRKGFKFTEVEDSNYHDLQSVAHQFDFNTTPENLIILMSNCAKVIGVSATATISTVIGNYDLKYIKSALKNKYISIDAVDEQRIANDFLMSQKVYDKVNINVELIDDLGCFTDKEKIETLQKSIWKGNLLNKYTVNCFNEKSENYYNLILLKLAYLYKQVGNKNIRSFLAFVNKLPKERDNKMDYNKLLSMFQDIAEQEGFDQYKCYVLQSENYDEEMGKVYSELSAGKKCFVISTYNTIGSGKNIQYPIPQNLERDMVIQDEKRYEKDFDGIYLITPTNLLQRLRIDSEDIYGDLARYLFQQQSLNLNNNISNGQYRQNIVNGFRCVFFSDFTIGYFSKNSDLCNHTAQIIIQAVGRICRSRNKNNTIHIYADTEVVERLQRVNPLLKGRLFNKEFRELFNTEIKCKKITTIEEFSKQNENASRTIKSNSHTIRSSQKKVEEWKDLRDYVLKNPTTNFIADRFEKLYFKFDSKTNGYSYKYGQHFNIIDIKLNQQEAMIQVSAQDCELPIMLSIPYVKKIFDDNQYATLWKNGDYIMTPSIYNQVYKGALGEFVGRQILNMELGWEVEEISDYSLYEYFDFKIKNIFIDFKHWKTFQDDPKKQAKKIKHKLNKSNGEKAIIINLIKRGNHKKFQNIDGDIIEIPYLIDENNEISVEMIDKINECIIS